MAAVDNLIKCLFVIIFLSTRSVPGVDAQLTPAFYDSTCPFVESIVRSGVEEAIRRDARMAASLLRLHFHDCMVHGCDGSILLDDMPGFVGEKNAFANVNSVRGYEVIDDIKSELESICPGMVSCSDILTIAARDSVEQSGGPSWDVSLGRRDSLTADKNAANQLIPGPGFSVAQLISNFEAVGLFASDVATLSGAHTIGAAKCSTFRQRFFNQSANGKPDPTIDPDYLRSVQQLCKRLRDPNILGSLDPFTPMQFDNIYYKNVQSGIALLGSDQALFSTHGITRMQVETYSFDQEAFFMDFATSMQRLGELSPLTEGEGEIRQNCRYVNSFNRRHRHCH
ncbi:hypothetical protein O6H91_18G028000 [Diphasiastrum complanatum]|uniref:Uncharacterized protein n=2 Tax=Diphasiastrum complanatum TaxID=34168 RepID=A0ACC2AZ56_DIPCM|nr:hypothetical protein O6H91_18G027800 [Diphasiastrum complanatum]KAJ7522811.1 hypothetical protein O6H91_18G028000 [Diphasiastrum complanatum]